MTTATVPGTELSGRGRHLPEAGLSSRLARIRAGVFAQTALAACLIVLIWPASLGGAFGVVAVAGHSMEPTFELGDVVITWKQPVEVGDVILYRVPRGSAGAGNPVIHRVVGGGPAGWQTRGDNMTRPDTWRPADGDVLGVAQFQIPLDAGVLGLLRSWWFVSFAVGLAVALLLWPDEPEDHRRARGRHRA